MVKGSSLRDIMARRCHLQYLPAGKNYQMSVRCLESLSKAKSSKECKYGSKYVHRCVAHKLTKHEGRRSSACPILFLRASPLVHYPTMDRFQLTRLSVYLIKYVQRARSRNKEACHQRGTILPGFHSEDEHTNFWID